jgi:hypothetical protein
MTDLVSKASQLCDLTLPSQAAFIGDPILNIAPCRQLCQCQFLTYFSFVVYTARVMPKARSFSLMN